MEIWPFRRTRSKSPIDELRADAVWVRERFPEIYVAILKQPGGRAAAAVGQAQEYVASWLGEFDEKVQNEGDRTDDSVLRQPRERVLSEWRVPA
jgi:hypothetical protein